MSIRMCTRLALIGAVILSASVAYTFWLKNAELREKNLEVTLQVQMLNAARTRDARSHEFLKNELEEENERLNQQLLGLSEITDEKGTKYLDSPVPDSVRQLFR